MEEVNSSVEFSSLDELEEVIDNDVDETISLLNAEYENFKTEIDTYEKYVEKVEDVESFYSKVYSDTKSLCVRLCKYSQNYVDFLLDSGESAKEMYESMEDLYDWIYDDAYDEIYDEIYSDLFDNLYDDYYDGIIDDAYETVEYSDWSDTHSDAYTLWSDTHSDVYRVWSDSHSDIYGFYSDIRSALYRDDLDRLQKKYDDFTEDIEKIENGSKLNVTSEMPLGEINNPEDLEDVASADVNNVVFALSNELEQLKSEVNDYDSFVSREEDVQAFYDKTVDEVEAACNRLSSYCVTYANLVLASGADSIDMYDQLEEIENWVYDDAFDGLSDGIYDDLFDEAEDLFYDGALEDKPDNVDYSDWYDMRSDEYSRWYDARSDVYGSWYDACMAVYEFYFDLRMEVYSGDIQKAQEIIDDFNEDLQ